MDIEDNTHSPMDVDESARSTRTRALTSGQERRLVSYLDDRFTECARNFRKRAEASSTLRTLPQYLEEARHLMALILQIPPIDPSTSLRTFYLLRLTGDVLSDIPKYGLFKPTSTSDTLDSDPPPLPEARIDLYQVRGVLRDLLDFLDDLDQAWLAVLQGLAWVPESAEGSGFVDLHHVTAEPPSKNDSEPEGRASNGHDEHESEGRKTTLPSQTDITRLKSLLLGGESAVEDWLLNENIAVQPGARDDSNDLTGLLDKMGLLDGFDAIFTATLDFLGGFGGEDVEDLGEEIPMSEPVTVHTI
ncbi:hypothetical protein D9611_012656 [Ephemerocybe angulata]|uniref:Uncharacterized protein n=1 Tax=Ephemerocybe angulata TaxID=980116 RepID=A0A8H5F0H2_9AGAR|nr:hypothetical protein D9611_012656 [Tulosesus angulatus]